MDLLALTRLRATGPLAVSVMQYGAGVVSSTKMELQNVDRKARKRMTIYGMLYPRGDVDRLYLPRENGGRRLLGWNTMYGLKETGLFYYVQRAY